MGSYPLSSQVPTHVEVELCCDKNMIGLVYLQFDPDKKLAFLESGFHTFRFFVGRFRLGFLVKTVFHTWSVVYFKYFFYGGNNCNLSFTQALYC